MLNIFAAAPLAIAKASKCRAVMPNNVEPNITLKNIWANKTQINIENLV